MSDIRAFVGHSFTEDDAQTVGCFLKYFDQLAKLNSGFSWQHAENAEPKQLSEKVMQLISDKNVFIGICTKKEGAVPLESALPMWLRPELFKVRRQSVTWKTSDWIIQEIGLAIGRGLDLILLIESGLRLPGGLQGNVEYIAFDRASPERSFGKITEMITALSPRASTISIASPDTRPITTAETEPPPADDDWNIPKADWKRSDYERALMRAVFVKDTQAMASIDQAYMKTEHAVQEENRDSWTAFHEYAVLVFGKGGSLAKLKKSAEEHPKNSQVLSYLARGFGHHEKYREAADMYEAAAREASDAGEKLRLLGRAAVANARDQNSPLALELISEMKATVVANPKGEVQLLHVLHELAQITKADDMELAVLERIVDIDPDDIELRYTLAHKHSECGNKDLALLHYLDIPYDERTAATWNNLGVAFQNASLRGKAVNAYRRSEEMGETLAMSNLAHLLIRAGFLPEAQQQCDKALKIENYDKNVVSALERLKELPDDEDKKESEFLEKAKPKSDFYKQFGRAASLLDAKDIDGPWKGPECVFEVKTTSGYFVAVGLVERPRGLLFGIGGLLGPTSSQKKIVHKIEYRGVIRGRAIEAKVTDSSEDDGASVAATALGSSDEKEKVLMILNEGGTELRMMEGIEGNSQQFYSLIRVLPVE